MIDPHVHLRDWGESHKETLEHGLSVAIKAGLDGVFEMPNTKPPILNFELAQKRISEVDKLGLDIFHGLYVGLTQNPEQISGAVEAHTKLFPRVVGLKLYACTGPLAVTEFKHQKRVFEILKKLDYEGILACHCEKQALISNSARPPLAEIESVLDIIGLANSVGFSGTLHICHASVPKTIDLVNSAKGYLKITCGVTPHHALLNETLLNLSAIYKVNPPLRPKQMQQQVLERLISGKVDWIESDHAPHLLSEKLQANPPGLPGLPYMQLLTELLKEYGMNQSRIDALTHDNIAKTYGVEIANSRRKPEPNLESEYQVKPNYTNFLSKSLKMTTT